MSKIEIKNSSILVSIIVPVYNISGYIERCVESILKQEHHNIEVLLVDDGSTDESASICDRFADSDNRVKVFHKLNGGLSDARNYGLDRALGKYIMLVDGDDYINADSCSRLLTDAVSLDADVVIGHYNFLKKKNTCVSVWEESISKNFEYHRLYTGKEYLYKCLVTSDLRVEVGRSLYKKSFLDDNALRFKKGILHEDEEFTPRMLLAADRIVLSDAYFYNYDNLREGSIMYTKNMKKAYDRIDIYNSLAKIYKNVTPKKLSNRLLDNICWKYLDCVISYNLLDEKGFVPQRLNMLRFAYTPKRRFKALVFAISPKLYRKMMSKVYN